MARWQPDSPGRLSAAALELFEERGFEVTTAAQIAERAGVTERTFFRHYADKREVLFAGGAALEEAATAAIDAAPAGVTPWDLAGAAAVAAASELPPERLPFARRRQLLLDATPGLQERELLKLASLGATIAQRLRHRGASVDTAGLAAEASMAAFRVGFVRWIREGEHGSFADFTREALGQLGAITTAAAAERPFSELPGSEGR